MLPWHVSYINGCLSRRSDDQLVTHVVTAGAQVLKEEAYRAKGRFIVVVPVNKGGTSSLLIKSHIVSGLGFLVSFLM